MGLDVIYVHVETNKSLRRTLEQCTLGYVPGTAHAPFVKNVNHVGSWFIYIKLAPLFTI